MRDDKRNIIIEYTFKFSLDIIDFCEELEKKRKYVLASQLLKAGTSIGANVREAQNAESKTDFIHKMKIAAKEADETQYFLDLCQYSRHYPDTTILSEKLQSIIKILSKIISTSKE